MRTVSNHTPTSNYKNKALPKQLNVIKIRDISTIVDILHTHTYLMPTTSGSNYYVPKIAKHKIYQRPKPTLNELQFTTSKHIFIPN